MTASARWFATAALAAATPLASAQEIDRALIDDATANQPALAPAGEPMTPVRGATRPTADTDAEAAARADVAAAQVRLETLLARKALDAGRAAEAARHARAAIDAALLVPADHAARDECETLELVARGVLTKAGPAAGDAAAQADGYAERTARNTLPTQRALRELTDASHLDVLVDAEAAAVAPAGDYGFPPDWPQRVASRTRWAGGELARSRAWTDADGNAVYGVVYDVQDLMYVPPNFASGWIWDMNNFHRDWFDRIALRERSWIFGGPASELAAGLPLLHYFGGVGGESGYYSEERQRAVAEMIRNWVAEHPDARILMVPPPR